jgi:hypothetical protein
MDDTLAEVRRIKEQCAVEALSRTPEEQAQEEERVIDSNSTSKLRPAILK